jgi:hypothetical protein
MSAATKNSKPNNRAFPQPSLELLIGVANFSPEMNKIAQGAVNHGNQDDRHGE